jgi:phenylpropionate dioxygenase-like ring-hydroxylating dioxygenase large terminal subunit
MARLEKRAISDTICPPGCTFDQADWRILAAHWYPIALVREIADGPVGTKLLDERLVVYRVGTEIVVAQGLCPHRGVPLSMGRYDGGGVVCPYHGLRFGVDGRCNHVPAQPDAPISDRLHLKTYPAVERYGLVWTCLMPATDIPADSEICLMPHWRDAGFQQIVRPWIDISAFAGRQIEAFLDVSHFAFVHATKFGSADNSFVLPYSPETHATGFQIRYLSTVDGCPSTNSSGKQVLTCLRHFNLHAPFTATLTTHFPDDKRLVIMNAASPISAKITRLFACVSHNFDSDFPLQDVYDYNSQIALAEKRIVEMQIPEYLPQDARLESHIPADSSSILYRNTLRDMGLSHFFIA